MKSASTIRLDAMWQEIGRLSNVTPKSEVASVLKLDERSLVLDAHPQDGIILSLWILASGIYMVFAPWAFYVALIEEPLPAGIEAGVSLLMGDALLIALLLIVFLACTVVLFYGVIVPTPSPILFDRHRRKVFGSHRGRSVALDWNEVRPILTQAKVYAGGAQTIYNLVLFQPESAENWNTAKTKRGLGILVTGGHPWGANVCQQMWEFIRIYMEEMPESASALLGRIEITPQSSSWISKVLDRGPYRDVTEPGCRMERLRDRKGIPEISWLNTFYVWFMGPASLLCFLLALLRPRLKLPSSVCPALAINTSPYQTEAVSAHDSALRLKAAVIVSVWLLSTITLGCWALVAGVQYVIN